MDSSNTTTILDAYSCKPFQSDTVAIKGVKIFSYCVLLLISSLGNSLLIAIIKRNKRMQTITNYLIANMAVSDILITVLAVPRKTTEILLGPRRWLINGLFGSVLCKSIYFLQDVSTVVSILSLAVIAIDRYRGIVFPFRKQLLKPAKFCKIIIPLIWIVPMGFHVIYFYIFRLTTNDTKTYCTTKWLPMFEERKSQETHYVAVLVFLIAIPACVATLLYSVVILNLKRSAIEIRKSTSSFMSLRRLREDKKIVRNIIAILIAFIVCIIPINIYGVLFYFVWDWKMPCGMENYGFAAFFILYLNPSVNPCIYFILNDRYRQGLKNILKLFHIARNNRRVLKRRSTELVSLVRLNTNLSACISNVQSS